MADLLTNLLTGAAGVSGLVAGRWWLRARLNRGRGLV